MPSDRSSKLEAKTESAPSEQSLLSDGDISPQNQEALLQIASMIRLAESFRLGFVKCNQPVQCLQMVEQAKGDAGRRGEYHHCESEGAGIKLEEGGPAGIWNRIR